MITSQQALDETIKILKEYLSDITGSTGDSHAYGFYQVARNIFVKFRVADHGLHMQTFISHNNGVPPELVNIISIIYRETPKEPIGTKWHTNGYLQKITVYQYVYPCWEMNVSDIRPIALELIAFAKRNKFVPPHLCTKDVKVQEVVSDGGIRDITNKMKVIYCSLEESNTNRTMKKKVVKINETQLRNFIAESVKKILTEKNLSNVATYSKPVAAWKMIRVAMEEIVNTMDETVRSRGGEQNITDEDVKRMLNNVNNTVEHCLSATMPQLAKKKKLGLVLTIPQTKKIEGISNYEFLVGQMPTKVKPGDRCYICYRGYVIGWMTIASMGSKDWQHPKEGTIYKRNFILCTGGITKIENPVPCKGFYNYMYIEYLY